MKDSLKRNLGALATFAASFVIATSALAQEIVTHEFTGTISFVTGNPLGLGLSSGDPVEGTITWDTSLPPNFDTGTVAGYIQPPPSGMSILAGGSTVQSSGNASFQMLNNSFGVDNINGFFSSVTVDGAPQSGSISFNFTDTTATVFDSTNPLPASLDADSFTSLAGGIFDGSDSASFSVDTLTLVKQEVEVAIDIKPGSFPNSIDPLSRGVIPVAILSTAEFDAATIDPMTVLFGPTGTEASPARDALEDVDGNGDADLILHFRTQDTSIACGDESATITGETFSGDAITGSDSIRTVGCR